MHGCIRLLQFHQQQDLAANLKDAQTSLRFFESVSQAAVFNKQSAKTSYVFPPNWTNDRIFLKTLNYSNVDSPKEGCAIILLDSRYIAKLDETQATELFDGFDADVTGLTIIPNLQKQREIVRLTPENRVAGFRRLYENTIEPAVMKELPHIIILKKYSSDFFTSGKWISSSVAELKKHVKENNLTLLHFQIGGELLNLQSLDDLSTIKFDNTAKSAAFRVRPLFSYARFFKRLLDIVASACILLIIFPLLVSIALLVKLTSPGPIFYPARRQGLHGKPFNCLKFRTMMVQADSMQERLRAVNQVDGPQFKIENDPRISGIGKFLRDTCIDELPQFFNVLLGQMSVVGPRPSPASENESCPLWRDARLSVRPGITGLWQVCRTRRNSMDFQEWVYFDTKYVKNLSLFLDGIICLKTAKKLICNLLDQFG